MNMANHFAAIGLSQERDHRNHNQQRLQALASLRGYKPGWAIHRFREKFGEAPSASVRASAAPIEDQAEQRRAVYDAMLEEEGGNSAWAAVRFRADTVQSAPRAG